MEDSAMDREIPEKWVLFTRHAIASPMDIGIHVREDEPKLRNLARRHGFGVCGPIEHAYWGMAVEGAPHVLEIWLPVRGGQEGATIPELKYIDRFKCLVSEFKQPIEQIGAAWSALGQEARRRGLTTTHHDREVYKVMDCDHPERNEIELQLGIE
jgi:effector-binding domain-containing protein